MGERQEEMDTCSQLEEARCLEFMGTMVRIDQTIQHTAAKGLTHVLLHDRRKIYSKILQWFALYYMTPPPFRVKLQARRGVRFKDPKSVFIGDGVNFDERIPESISLGRGVWIAAGCRIISHRFISYRFAERAQVVLEDLVDRRRHHGGVPGPGSGHQPGAVLA